MDEQFGNQHAFKQAATLRMGTLHTLTEADLGVGLLDVGVLDDCLTHNGHNAVHNLLVLGVDVHRKT